MRSCPLIIPRPKLYDPSETRMPLTSKEAINNNMLSSERSKFLNNFKDFSEDRGEIQYELHEIVEHCQSLIEEEDYDNATLVLSTALKKWPKDISLNGVLADCYCQRGMFSESCSYFELVFQESEEEPFWALVGYANALENLGHYLKSYQYLLRAMEKEYNLGIATRVIKLSIYAGTTTDVAQQVIVLAKESVENNKIRSEHYRTLGDVLMELSHHSLAHQLYDESHLADKASTLPVTRKIKHLIRSNLLEQAKLVIQNWKELWPNDRRLKRFEKIRSDTKIADKVRVVAFYLPQYHPIAENNEWWGEGFTEWSNVASATGNWHGHNQPRLPADMGYYDLRLPEVYDKQTSLASEYGIDGFCFYYYWFNGRKILEKPLQNILDKKTRPFPFSICWVNENWTRSWDGMTGEVLVSTEHSLEMNTRFIEDVFPILSDENYIRVENKPVLTVYCAEKLDLTDETLTVWREYCRSRGLGEIYICAVQSFGFGDPTDLGYDAAIEFPPHAIPSKNEGVSHLEIENVSGLVPDFKGKVFSYPNFADHAMNRPRENYTLHRTCMLAWDNTARRGKQAHIYGHFSVDKYQQWMLTNMRKAVVEQSDPLVFVNAWNEWAEGSYLEPDTVYGHELLAATRRAKRATLWNKQGTYWKPQIRQALISETCRNENILMIGHDAHKNGAQINFLCMLQNLVRDKKKRVTVILKEGGDLVPQYEQYGKVYILGDSENRYEIFQGIVRDYQSKGATKAICNTCVTGDLTEILHNTGYNVISLIHELPGIIEQYGLTSHCETLVKNADSIVFASQYVADKFAEKFAIKQDKVHVFMQGIKHNPYLNSPETVRAEVRAEFGIPEHGQLIIGCGYGDIRKGIDLFVQLANIVSRKNTDAYFIWIGDIEEGVKSYLDRDMAEVIAGRLIVTGYREDTGRILVAGDIFALTSREDPFPSVLMEAMEAGLAVFAFENCGGYQSIVNRESGGLVPFGDLNNYAESVNDLLTDSKKCSSISARNARYAADNFGYKNYLGKLLELAHTGYMHNTENHASKVTVIIPNYNYAQYLGLRLETVLGQSRLPDEIIILDDASADNSLQVIEDYTDKKNIDVIVIKNKENSGNVFLQWKKGLERATGDLVWIAEADDYCDQDFLHRMCAELRDPAISLAFCNSIMVDEFGASHGASYSEYYLTHFSDYFETGFHKNGVTFVNEVMTRRNAVMNASAVVFRRVSAVNAIEKLGKLKLSGDWLFWIELCMTGDISYTKDSYNYHRRHRKSVLGRALEEKSEILREMLVLLDEITDEYGDHLSKGSLEAALNSIQGTYQELFGNENGIEPIETHPELASEYLRVIDKIYPGINIESVVPESVRKQVNV